MKTIQNFYRIPLLISILAIISFSSCKKDNDDLNNSPDSDTEVYKTAAKDFGQSEEMGNEIDVMADEAARGHFGPGHNQGMLNPCATVTHDTISIPHVLTIDFGPVNCQGMDGKWRRGMIIITYQGHYFDPGSVRSLTFQNYYVNNNHIEGTRTVTNNGLNSSGNMNWSISVVNFRITRPNGQWHERNSNRSRTIISGFGTSSPWDDVYLISGSSNGSNSNGNSVTATVITDLRKEIACHWIVSGSVDITPLNRPTRTLDFGNGACDNQATITVNGVTHIITLH
jgi:hypothetical protein